MEIKIAIKLDGEPLGERTFYTIKQALDAMTEFCNQLRDDVMTGQYAKGYKDGEHPFFA